MYILQHMYKSKIYVQTLVSNENVVCVCSSVKLFTDASISDAEYLWASG